MKNLLKVLGLASLISGTASYAAYAWIDRALGRMKW
jgi:hypothetical protein